MASPGTSGSVSGCTVHAAGLGHSGLAPPFSHQHPGAAFPQTGIRDSQCPAAALTAGLVAPLVWGSDRDGAPLHAETDNM